jgi:hypothetical protein
MTIIKLVLGMKFGWVILLVLGIILLLSFVKNIISGNFSVGKLAAGFNPFTGAIQGKLIWMAIWAFIFFTAYQFIMRPTTSYDTDYKNQIHHNDDVIIDQRVGPGCEPTKILWGLIQIGCKGESIKKEENNTTNENKPDCSCTEKKQEEPKKDTTKKDTKKK